MNEDKLELCQSAVRDHPFIRVSSWEITRGHPVDFGAVLEHIRSIVPAWVDVLYGEPLFVVIFMTQLLLIALQFAELTTPLNVICSGRRLL